MYGMVRFSCLSDVRIKVLGIIFNNRMLYKMFNMERSQSWETLIFFSRKIIMLETF